MTDDQTPEQPPKEKQERRMHPLEAQAQLQKMQQEMRQRAAATGEADPRQRTTLHIPVVQPTITQILIVINSAIFFIAFFIMNNAQANELYDWGASNRHFVLDLGEYHRLFSAMFLHGNLMHLVFNMYALWAIGQTVERFFGHVRFAIIYFLGGLCGSILSVMLNPASVTSVGASGAVFAIFGAEMVFLYKHQKLLGPMAKAQLRQLAIVAGINFLYGIGTSFNTQGVSIDNWGHVGGFIGGLAIAWIISPLFIPRPHPTQKDHLTITDINPLEDNYQKLSGVVTVMLLILVIGAITI